MRSLFQKKKAKGRKNRLLLEVLEQRRPLAFDLTVVDANTESNAIETLRAPVALGSTAFFYGSDQKNGVALWKSDGTSPGTVMFKDLDANLNSSSLSMARIGSSLYFAAAANSTQLGLWKTDGTAANTSLVKILGPQTVQIAPKNMTVVNSTLYFNSGGDLWQSNGTSSGTIVASAFEPLKMQEVGGSLYFTIATPTGESMIKKGSGPAVPLLTPGSVFSNIANLTNVAGSLYFTAFEKISNQHRLLKHSTGFLENVGVLGNSPNLQIETEVVGGTLFLKTGNTLRKISETTPLETVRSDFTFLQGLTNVSGKLFFEATTPATGIELWKSDGSQDGTFVVKDITSGPESSNLTHLTNINGTLYFANEIQGETSLWKSNGTGVGTTRVKELDYPVSDTPFANIGGNLYFSLDTDQFAGLLWRSNGTEAGTSQVKLVQTVSSNASQMTTVGKQLFFTALESDFATELWVTDGTQNGLKKLDVNFAEGSEPSYLTNVNGTLYFAATHSVSGTELWKSDGTSAGTVLVSDLRRGNGSSFPRHLTNVNGSLYFTAESALTGRELWRLERGEPVLVRDIRVGAASSDISNLVNIGSRLYFTANDGSNGVELWSSNGTASSTAMVSNIAPGPASSNPKSLTAVGTTLFFQANDGTNGAELWKSKGTNTTTGMVRNLAAGGLGSAPNNLTNLNGSLYFSANDGLNGTELFKSDGTLIGTARVTDISSGRGSSHPSDLTNVLGTLYFSATDTSGDRELWKLTSNIVTKAGNINPTGSSNPNELRNVNGLLYFGANDGVHGNELMQFDGAIMRQVIDHVPGLGNGNPAGIVPFGQSVAWASTSTLFGREVFIYDPLRGSTQNDHFRVTPESVLGTDVVSIYKGSTAATAKLAARFAPSAQVRFDGLDGIDRVSFFGTDIQIDQAGVHLQGITLDITKIEMRELHTLSVDAVVRFDTDSPLGDWIVSTPAINSNLLDFSKSSLPIQLDLGDSNMQTINTNLRLQLPIASIPNAIGSTADDVIYGNGQSNSISGGDGNDLLVGRGGNDQLNGNGGNDELRGLAGNDQLTGGLGDDIYWFEDSVALELDNVIEAVDAGIDRIDFQPSTSNVTFNLGLTSIQNSQLNRSIQLSAGDVIEVLFGSQANDTLTGNGLDNVLNGKQGSDILRGGLGNDSYAFDEVTGLNELDTVTELVDAGLDTIDFSAITTSVQLNLGLATPQTVHGTRSIKLNSPSTFENVSGGSGDDILVGNNRANILLGHAGNDTLSGFGNRDLLIGGLGMDTLLGGTDQDILIPCTTTHDQTMRALNELISEWSSASSYAQRVTNLKNGVGVSGVALEPLVDVLDDNDALDQMSGEVNTDWFFKDASDVILDLNGEIVEAL